MKACTEHPERDGGYAYTPPALLFLGAFLYARKLPAAAAEIVAVGNVSFSVEVRVVCGVRMCL